MLLALLPQRPPVATSAAVRAVARYEWVGAFNVVAFSFFQLQGRTAPVLKNLRRLFVASTKSRRPSFEQETRNSRVQRAIQLGRGACEGLHIHGSMKRLSLTYAPSIEAGHNSFLKRIHARYLVPVTVSQEHWASIP